MAPNDRSSSRPNSGGGRPASGGRGSSGRPGAKPGGRPGGKPAGSRGGSTDGRNRSPEGPKTGRPTKAGGPLREEPRTAGPKQWGSLGRKGAGRLTSPEFDARDSVGATGRDGRPAPANRQSDRWVRVDDDVRSTAKGAVKRAQQAAEPASSVSKARRGRDFRKAGAGSGGADAKAELVAALGAARGARSNERLRDAAHAFERERYDEARLLLKPLAELAPGAMSVRELLGLTYYRLGRWKDAVRELEAFRAGTDSTEQHPVLADAYRGLKKHRQVEELWDELRDASPSADLVTEGRIVMAGSLADRKQLSAAIALLEKSQRSVKRPQIHHLRQAYALADLYERAGDVARAREVFRWVVLHEPDFADAAERASSLG